MLIDFRGILDKSELRKIYFLSDDNRKKAEEYLTLLSTIYLDNVFCSDFEYAYQYANLCKLLDINIELFLCRIDEDVCSKNRNINENHYVYLGYDYIMKEETYSCIVQEKHLIDQIEKIKLNDNGLLNNYNETQKFAELREEAKKKQNGNGFELGVSNIDFYPVAIFKYIKL